MSEMNPLDRFFRDKLRDHASETPMHLWEGIQARRKQRFYKLLGLFSVSEAKTLALVLLLSGLSAALLYALWDTPNAERLVAVTEAPEAENGTELKEMPLEQLSETSTSAEAIAKAETHVIAIIESGTTELRDRLSSAASTQTDTRSIDPEQRGSKEMLALNAGNTVLKDSETEALALDARHIGTESETAVQSAREGREESLPRKLRVTSPIWQNLRRLDFPSPSFSSPEDGCHGFKKHKWSLMADVTIAPEFAIRSLSAKDAEYASYAGQRNETENPTLSYSLGLRLTALSSTGLGIRSGLHFTQINEDFSYRTENEERIEIITIKDSDGNVIGRDTNFWYGGVDYGTRNLIRSIDIPLMAGYEFEGQNLTISVYGGVFVNLLFDARGSFLSPDNMPVSFSNRTSVAEHQVYRKDVGLSMVGSIGMQYQLSPRVKLLLEPQLRYFMEPLTRADYPLNQNFLVVGVQTGLRYQLR